jgi:hypothetical protein
VNAGISPGKHIHLARQTHTSRQANTYILDMNDLSASGTVSCLISKASEDVSMLWHKRMGHVNLKLSRNDLVRGLPIKEFFQ